MDQIFDKVLSAELWIKLFLDPVFVSGAVLLFISVIGFVLLIKSLQKQSESTAPLDEPPAISPKKPAISLETLSQQLSRIEFLLKEISKEVGQTQNAIKKESKGDPNALKDELKTMLENVMVPGAAMEKSEDVQQLTAKVDKIYQVLVNLSDTAERQ